jgi:hypothetical protein
VEVFTSSAALAKTHRFLVLELPAGTGLASQVAIIDTSSWREGVRGAFFDGLHLNNGAIRTFCLTDHHLLTRLLGVAEWLAGIELVVTSGAAAAVV